MRRRYDPPVVSTRRIALEPLEMGGREVQAGEVMTVSLLAAGHDPALVERVLRLVDAAEYKRRQYPPGPKISQKNFGRDRRLPITNRWREHCEPS